MPRPKSAIPQPLIHAASNRLYVRFTDGNGKRRQVYFGDASDPSAYEAYQRWVAEAVKTGGRTKPSKAPSAEPGIYVLWELIDAFLKHAANRYRKRGEFTSTAHGIQRACQLLIDSGDDINTAVKSFGPRRLRLYQEYLASLDLSQVTINRYVTYIRRMFSWAAEQELIEPEQVYKLRAVPGVRAGVPVGSSGTAPRRTEPRDAVPLSDIKAVFPAVTRGVRAMIRMQLLTGARPGEICGMRVGDVAEHPQDTSCMVYTVRPEFDKVAHHDKTSPTRVFLGPRASRLFRVLARGRSSEEFLFSPTWSYADHRRRAAVKGTRRSANAVRKPRGKQDRYTVAGYRRAIARACEVVGCVSWSPHQLRHTRASKLAAEAGVVVARDLLSHTDLQVTNRYVHADDSDRLAAIRISG